MLFFFVDPRAPTDHCKDDLNVASQFGLFGVVLRVSCLLVAVLTCRGLLSRLRGRRDLVGLVTNEGAKRFHDRPVVFLRISGNAFQGINAANAHCQVVAAEQFNGFAVALSNLAVFCESKGLVCSTLFVVLLTPGQIQTNQQDNTAKCLSVVIAQLMLKFEHFAFMLSSVFFERLFLVYLCSIPLYLVSWKFP